MLILLLTSALIATNWLIYVWAVVRGHVLETSLGYYLNPLVQRPARRRPAQGKAEPGPDRRGPARGLGGRGARLGRGVGIVDQPVARLQLRPLRLHPQGRAGRRARRPVDRNRVARPGLACLSALGAPGPGRPCRLRRDDHLPARPRRRDHRLPLLLFNAAAKRLPYSTLGFLQYIAPSLQFLLAVLAFGEPFTPAHALCFGAIWAALAIFAVEGLRLGRARAKAAAAEILEPCP